MCVRVRVRVRYSDLVEKWLELGNKPTLMLEPCNTYRIRLLYQELGRKYQGRILLESTGEGPRRTMKVTRLSQEGKEQMAREIRERQEVRSRARRVRLELASNYHDHQAEYLQGIGFRRVIDVLIEARKPLIGHNMFLDILHIHHRFIGPLPSTCEEFKHKIHQAFPMYIPQPVDSRLHVHTRTRRRRGRASYIRCFTIQHP